MPRKKWTNDGPRHSSGGYRFDWRLVATIAKMSREADATKAEIALVQAFFDSQPELRRKAIGGLFNWKAAIDFANDLLNRRREELARRRAAVERWQRDQALMMDRITIDGMDYKYFHVGIGRAKKIFYNRTVREAIGVADPRNVDPTKVLLDAIFNKTLEEVFGPPKYQEVSDNAAWERVVRRLKN